jgi:uncharacterized Zn-binding protein involved in type VI secretion
MADKGAIVRIGDKHECGAVALTGSDNWDCNGIAIHREGDYDTHGTDRIPHIEGSPNWFCNGQAIARKDLDNCQGHYILPPHPANPHVEGSPNWNINRPGA